MDNKSIYEPKEDSTLLEKYVKKFSKGNVLDMGTGSGIQAIAAAKNKKVISVLAVDIQEEVIAYCKENIKNPKIKFLVSDLFEKIKPKKFDVITFNPPYLPSEVKLKDLTLEGGKKGYEVLERFLNKVNDYLKKDGIALILFSSLTKKDKVEQFVKSNLLDFKLLEKQHYFFEDLYVYRLEKSTILKKLESKKIEKVKYFTKGKRGFIFVAKYSNKKVAIKIKNPESKAISRIENEINTLKKINKKNIGPKILLSGKNFLVYKFIEGQPIIDYLETTKLTKQQIKKIITNIFNQLFELDKLKINKEEMSHPTKHILIDKKNKPYLIDFERARYTQKTANVTQFCDFLLSKRISTILGKNNIKLNKKKVIKLAKNYKKNQNKKNLKSIMEIITKSWFYGTKLNIVSNISFSFGDADLSAKS